MSSSFTKHVRHVYESDDCKSVIPAFDNALTTLAITPGVSVIFEPINVTFAQCFFISYYTLYFFKISSTKEILF